MRQIYSLVFSLSILEFCLPPARGQSLGRFTVINSAGTDLGLAEIEVWESGASKAAETTDEENFPADADATRHFALSPIYPNPFSPHERGTFGNAKVVFQLAPAGEWPSVGSYLRSRRQRDQTGIPWNNAGWAAILAMGGKKSKRSNRRNWRISSSG